MQLFVARKASGGKSPTLKGLIRSSPLFLLSSINFARLDVNVRRRLKCLLDLSAPPTPVISILLIHSFTLKSLRLQPCRDLSYLAFVASLARTMCFQVSSKLNDISLMLLLGVNKPPKYQTRMVCC